MPGARLGPSSLLVAALFGWLAGQSPLEGALVEYDLEKLARKSDRIVRGRVTTVRCSWGRMGHLGPVILTHVTIAIEERLKGPAGEREMTIELLGGAVGKRLQLCPESPRYAVGEEVLVFARERQGRLWTTGWIQGKYRLLKDASGRRKIVCARGLPIRAGEDYARIRDRVRTVLRAQALERSRAVDVRLERRHLRIRGATWTAAGGGR